MRRWTAREEQAHQRGWLRQRMAHAWSEDGPCRCARCGAKYSPTQVVRACLKRRRPNRWRLHWQRYKVRSLYGGAGKPEGYGTAGYWREQLRQIAREAARVPELQPDHPRYPQYWKYHKLSRRHRRACRELWRLPLCAGELAANAPPDTFGGQITRQRNKLIAEVRATQARVIRREGCTYTFRADAHDQRGPLFTEGG